MDKETKILVRTVSLTLRTRGCDSREKVSPLSGELMAIRALRLSILGEKVQSNTSSSPLRAAISARRSNCRTPCWNKRSVADAPARYRAARLPTELILGLNEQLFNSAFIFACCRCSSFCRLRLGLYSLEEVVRTFLGLAVLPLRPPLSLFVLLIRFVLPVLRLRVSDDLAACVCTS